MNPYIRTFLMVSSLCILPAWADDPIIAKVGDKEIKASELRPVLDGLSDSEREALKADPSALNQVARSLIAQQLLFKEAQAAVWEKLPDVVARVERSRQATIAETYLASIAKVPDAFPSQDEVVAFYESQKSSLQVPKQWELAQIFIACPKDATKSEEDAARSKVEALSKALKAPGADFAALARDKSEERETASRGGNLGWLPESGIRPEIRSKLAALPKSGTSEPIRLDDGFYFVKLLDIKEPRTATLDEVRNRIVAALRAERARLNREAALARIQQQNPVSVNEVALDSLLSK